MFLYLVVYAIKTKRNTTKHVDKENMHQGSRIILNATCELLHDPWGNISEQVSSPNSAKELESICYASWS